ncbi:transposase [Labrys wisconsinensis]|uniref:Transposase n=1 Tax=Labrys wisconsinensis TaxID=425677 RepID=A0ABU0JGT4_9HYPH|nr:transposase [Labrys wisconsinensis]MDQ0473502.1 putative transposase [Labrys wisconsinensis]
MARIARLVVPGLAHHVTQRGNRRERVFFTEDDYRAYLNLLKAYLPKSGTRLLAWCLMPNHVHLLAVPDGQDGLRALLGEVHRRYTAGINARNGWTGHLWQGRFGSVVMEEDHLVHAVRYVCLNPVRAKLVTRAEDWPWASTRAHLSGRDDGLTDLTPVRERFATFADLLDSAEDEAAVAALRRSERTGRPLGSASWLAGLEATTGRVLARRKPGPRPELSKLSP